VILLRRYRPDVPQPFVMWLYPVPALIALGLWVYVFVSAPVSGMLFAAGVVAAASPRTCFLCATHSHETTKRHDVEPSERCRLSSPPRRTQRTRRKNPVPNRF